MSCFYICGLSLFLAKYRRWTRQVLKEKYCDNMKLDLWSTIKSSQSWDLGGPYSVVTPTSDFNIPVYRDAVTEIRETLLIHEFPQHPPIFIPRKRAETFAKKVEERNRFLEWDYLLGIGRFVAMGSWKKTLERGGCLKRKKISKKFKRNYFKSNKRSLRGRTSHLGNKPSTRVD